MMSALTKLQEKQQLYGCVIKGKQLGRTIGFPTANVNVEVEVSLNNGVYGVRIYRQNKVYFGVMNVGKRPTFDDGEHMTYEVHILDFHHDIYDEQILVEIMFYIRPEQKFNQLKDLIQQLHADVFHARKQFRSVFNFV